MAEDPAGRARRHRHRRRRDLVLTSSRPAAEHAVRVEAERSGRSQQEVIRAAIDTYLGLTPAEELVDEPADTSELGLLLAARAVRPPRSPYRRPGRRLTLPSGVTSSDLLDREDRL